MKVGDKVKWNGRYCGDAECINKLSQEWLRKRYGLSRDRPYEVLAVTVGGGNHWGGQVTIKNDRGELVGPLAPERFDPA